MHRPNLLAGAERELVLSMGIVTALLVVVAMNWFAAATGVFVWVVGLGVLRAMAKADPHMSKVYTRHVRYRAYYPARARLTARGAEHRR